MEFHGKIVGVNGISWEYGNITVIISWRVVRVVQDLLILFWNDSPSNFCTPILTNTKIMAVGVCKIMVRRGWAAGYTFRQSISLKISRGLGSHNSPRLFPASVATLIDIQIFYPDESWWIQVWVRLKIGTRNSNGLYGLSICFIWNYEHGHFITGAIPAIPQFSNNPIILYEFNIWTTSGREISGGFPRFPSVNFSLPLPRPDEMWLGKWLESYGHWLMAITF
jgi:hypothetical protein